MDASLPPSKSHVIVAPGDVKWGPPPEGIAQGEPPAEFANEHFEVAVLSGDPTKPGEYTIPRRSRRFRLAATL